MEIFDIYDNNRIKTGKTKARGVPLDKGEYHLMVVVLIFDSAGRMLVQKRGGSTGWMPGAWTCTAGGGVCSDESPDCAATRELFEELGIKHNFRGRPANFSRNIKNGFIDYFILKKDIDINTLNVPNEEVADVKWVDKKEMLNMIKEGKCVNYPLGFVEYCFDNKETSF